MSSSEIAQHGISIPDPRPVTDELRALVLLQSLFATRERELRHWKQILDDHNVLCISTDRKSKLALDAKNGHITFYSKNHEDMRVDVSGETIAECIYKFVHGLSTADHCKVYTREYETGNTSFKEFTFYLRYKNHGILRQDCFTNYHSGGGANGDL